MSTMVENSDCVSGIPANSDKFCRGILAFITCLTIIALFAAACTAPPRNSLTFQARPCPWYSDYEFAFSVVNDTILPGFPIWLRTEIVNASDHILPIPEVSVNFYPESPISILSFDADSHQVCCCWQAMKVPWWTGFGGRLLPGLSQVTYSKVCDGLSPGSFHVDVRVDWDSFAERPARSPRSGPTFPVTVTVTPPQEDQASTLYYTAYSLLCTPYDTAGRQRGHDKLLDLVDEFPASRYDQLALERAHSYERYNPPADTVLAHQAAYRLLREFPTAQAVSWLRETSSEPVGMSASRKC